MAKQVNKDDDPDVLLKRSQIKTLVDQARAGDKETICPTAKKFIKKLDKEYEDEEDDEDSDEDDYDKEDNSDGKYRYKLPKIPVLTNIKKFFK